VTNLELAAVTGGGAFGAGVLGALTGLGGGIVIVPLLVLGCHVDLHYAIGASLVAVIATSSGAAAAYVREGFTNVRIGMVLEIATSLGAIAAAFAAAFIPTGAIAVLFGLVLLYSAYLSLHPPTPAATGSSDPLAVRLHLTSTYPGPAGPESYEVHRVGAGFGLMFVAGALSGLLGIGSGAVKVLAMDHVMGLPFKVSTTTSNFMIGVTAAASAGVYLHRGYIDPGLALPVMLGVLAGASLGARMLAAAAPHALRIVFTGVVVVLAAEMLYRGFTGRL
jgi:uncharacterized membrane protein YfcA